MNDISKKWCVEQDGRKRRRIALAGSALQSKEEARNEEIIRCKQRSEFDEGIKKE